MSDPVVQRGVELISDYRTRAYGDNVSVYNLKPLPADLRDSHLASHPLTAVVGD
jgi:hypothetical protein